MLKRLDRLSLLIGRIIVYPTTLCVIFAALYVPTFAFMHKDDNQLVVKWHTVPDGVAGIDRMEKRSDFDMTADEAAQFMDFFETAQSHDMITVNGLRFLRGNVGRAVYYGQSTFPQDLVDTAKKLYISSKKYTCEMIDIK